LSVLDWFSGIIAALAFGRLGVLVKYVIHNACSILIARTEYIEAFVMLKTVPKSSSSSNSGRTRRNLRSLFAYAALCLVFGFAGGFVERCAAAEEARNVAAPVSPGPQLAISDFDGDLRPDLASVQTGATASGSTDYWIQLQLSASGRQSIRLVAPAGGLLIEARDVNGDHAVDLILSTSFREPVAVFLNDGHGSFSRVTPSAFPGAFNKPLTSWVSASDQAMDTAAVPAQLRPGICRTAKALANIQSKADSISGLRTGFTLDSFLVSQAGRAPPA
jgi:hypothetical protein